jgi:hypothetical protein
MSFVLAIPGKEGARAFQEAAHALFPLPADSKRAEIGRGEFVGTGVQTNPHYSVQ